MDTITKQHAMVVRDGFRVPLLGIPASAVLQECDSCHDEFPLVQIELIKNQALCRKCRKSNPENPVHPV